MGGLSLYFGSSGHSGEQTASAEPPSLCSLLLDVGCRMISGAHKPPRGVRVCMLVYLLAWVLRWMLAHPLLLGPGWALAREGSQHRHNLYSPQER